ncbi:MAG: thiamine pyrophosphate-dependent enzyme, partial [Candidatus Zixiibacteriota bacterium]
SRVDDAQSNRLIELAKQARRGVIVSGTLPSCMDPTPIVELADRWQWPLIADVCSGVRSTGRYSSNIICHADLYLRNATICETLKPDLVLQFGTSPISKSVANYAASSSAEYIVVVDQPERIDPHHRVTLRMESSAVKLASQLLPAAGVPRSELLERFVKYDSLAADSISKALAVNGQQISELQVASEIARLTPADRGLFLATSMPIREFDCVAPQTEHRLSIAANRGANGIDGTIASAVGFADGLGLPVTLLIGDVAALHDLNSLALLKQARQSITVIILNNDGGGIFSMLPVAAIKSHFEEFFGTPHGLGFLNAADMFGIKYHCPNSIKDFCAVYRHSLKSNKSAIIEIGCSRKDNVEQHRQLWKAVQERVEKYAVK